MASDPPCRAGPAQTRAAEVEAAIQRCAQRLPTLPVLEASILRLLSLLGRDLSSVLEETLRPHGLNETDFRTLMMLFSQADGVAHPSDLCTYVAQSPANMTRVADSLCERGLITRGSSEEDRRRTILRTTPEGEALVHQLLPRIIELTSGLFRDLSLPARRQLLEQLRCLIGSTDRCAERGGEPPREDDTR